MDKLTDKYWRMNNLYKIVDKNGKKITFRFNEEQERMWRECFNSKGQLIVNPDVLKARQLGVTTFFTLIYFDDCIWTRNLTCYIQSHEQDSIKKIFRYVRLAYDNLDDNIKPELDRGGGSQYEYYFPELNSRIYVGLENRSNTVHRLHISEVAFQPQSRIVASLGSLPPGVHYSRETTPNGLNWYFEDYFSKNQSSRKKVFFPWFDHDKYKLPSTIEDYTAKELKYLDKIEKKTGKRLSREQMTFKRQKIADLLSEQAFDQEFPSDEESCFLVANPERSVLPEVANANHLIQDVERPKHFKSYVFIDLGLKDSTAMLFAYYDFDSARIVIEDELIVSYWTTRQKVERATEIEHDYGYEAPKRISDNDLQQLFDLNKDYGYRVLGVTKRSKQKGVNYRESLINQLRVAITAKKIVINPRCKNLIFQLSYGMWNEHRTDFERNYDIKNMGVVMGHLDGLMALAYGFDNIDWNENPYPDQSEVEIRKLDEMSQAEVRATRDILRPKKKAQLRKKFRF